MFSGTGGSSFAFVFSLDAVVFHKNFCLDNRICFRALNSYIKARASWEGSDAMFEFLVTGGFEENFCRGFMYIFRGVEISVFG